MAGVPMRIVYALLCLVAACPIAACGAAAANILREPDRLCTILADRDLPTGSWGAVQEIIDDQQYRTFRCIAEPIPVRGARGSSKSMTSLAFFAESRFGDRVEQVKLVLNVHDEAARDVGKKKLKEIAAVLFERLEIEEPAELPGAIDETRAGTFRQPYGSVVFGV